MPKCDAIVEGSQKVAELHHVTAHVAVGSPRKLAMVDLPQRALIDGPSEPVEHLIFAEDLTADLTAQANKWF